ncbi:MAG: hypothetical protein ABSF44_00170 [Candidatus Bathyarchaeia archaeon]|jgi:N-acetylneuraminic acid mutarotase
MKKTLGLFLILIGFTASCLTSIQFTKAQSENSWVQKAPMPTARSDFGVAVVNEVIYAIGGSVPIVIGNEGTSASTNVTEAYDPTTNAWTEKATMPVALSSFGIAVYQNKIYCIGQNQNEVYNPTTNTWETKTPMPDEAYQLQANVVNNKIYLIGGYPKGAVNEVYDPATDSWTTKTPIPTPVADYTSAVVDSKIYIFSGQAIGSYPNGEVAVTTNRTQIYNTKTNSWSLGAAIPMGVSNAAAGLTNGAGVLPAIYVMGGCNDTYPLDAQVTNQVYFPENNSWGVGASMPIDRAWLSVAVVNNTLYAIGGGHNLFTKASTVNMQYTPFSTTNLSTSSTTPVPELPTWAAFSLVIATLLSIAFKKKIKTKAFS